MSESHDRSHLLAIAELAPAEELNGVEPGAVRPDPAQEVQLANLLEHRVLAPLQDLPPLGLQPLDQRRVEYDPLPLAAQTRAQALG